MNTCFVVFDDKRFELLLRFKVLLGEKLPKSDKDVIFDMNLQSPEIVNSLVSHLVSTRFYHL